MEAAPLVDGASEVFMAVAETSLACLILCVAPAGITDPADLRVVFVNSVGRALFSIDETGSGLGALSHRLRAIAEERLVALAVEGGTAQLGQLTLDGGAGPGHWRWSATGLQRRHVVLRGEGIAEGEDDRRRTAVLIREDVGQVLAAARLVVEGLQRSSGRDEAGAS